jgi:hypothetical protein
MLGEIEADASSLPVYVHDTLEMVYLAFEEYGQIMFNFRVAAHRE